MGVCGKIVFFIFVIWFFWFCRLLYGMSPYFYLHGDVVRSLREWKFWFGWSFYAHDYANDFKALRNFYIYEEDFPDFTKDEPMRVYYVDNDNVTQEIIDATWKRGEGVLVWRNATKGAHEDMMDLDWVRENFDGENEYHMQGDGDTYYFYNDTNFTTAYEYPALSGERVTMKDFIDHTLDGEHLRYYLGFSFNCMQQNPLVRNRFFEMYDKALEPYCDKPDYYRSTMDKDWIEGQFKHWLEFFFMYYGTESYTPFHTAISDDMFIQIHNTKRWVLIHPRYYPYVMATYKTPFSLTFIDFEDVPKEWVDIGPGDLLYFPPQYIHAVVNMEDTWGMGLGLRDVQKSITLMAKNMLFGSNVEANVGPFYQHWFQAVKGKILGTDFTAELNRKSGLNAAFPNGVFDQYQLDALKKHIADNHNKFEHLFMEEVERGVETGRGPKNPNSMLGPDSGLSPVRTTAEAIKIWAKLNPQLEGNLKDGEGMAVKGAEEMVKKYADAGKKDLVYEAVKDKIDGIQAAPGSNVKSDL